MLRTLYMSCTAQLSCRARWEAEETQKDEIDLAISLTFLRNLRKLYSV